MESTQTNQQDLVYWIYFSDMWETVHRKTLILYIEKTRQQWQKEMSQQNHYLSVWAQLQLTGCCSGKKKNATVYCSVTKQHKLSATKTLRASAWVQIGTKPHPKLKIERRMKQNGHGFHLALTDTPGITFSKKAHPTQQTTVAYKEGEEFSLLF